MRHLLGEGRGKLGTIATSLTITSGLLLWGATSASAAEAGGQTAKPVGAAPVIPKNSAAMGKVPASQALDFDIVLNPRDPAGLNALALAVSTPGSPDRGQFLTVSQFAARFGQTPAAIQAADAALRGVGLTAGQAAANGLVIPVSTTIGQAETSLHISFADYKLGSGRVAFANTSAPSLPSAVASLTAAVIGLNNLATPVTSPPKAAAAATTAATTGSAAARPDPASATGPVACQAAVQEAQSTGGWTYPQLAAAYSITGLYQHHYEGSGTRIALFELDPWSQADISKFKNCYGVGTSVSSVKVDGGDGTGVGEGEAALDIETAIGLAPRSQISVYDAPASNYALSTVDEYTKIFDDDTAQVVSSSYGLCESVVEDLSPGLIASENTLFEQAAAEGMSVFAASGDSGSEGCYRATSSDALAVLDPAAQPFVTAVGGTSLTATGTPPTERVWNDGVVSGEGAAGGGISSVWTMPAWQSGPGVINGHSSGEPCLAASGDCREVPDVSASADPVHGYIIRWNGEWLPIGGTSAATPLWAAMLADVESSSSPVYRAGLLNPLLYSAAATGHTTFNDITVGNNDYTDSHGGLYPATTAYDLASGLGSPIATGLLADVAAARSKIAFTDAPGTGAPPPSLGTHKMKAFKPFSCEQDALYAKVSGPTGNLGFAPDLECLQIGSGWATWSNGYAGDVYYDGQNPGGTSTITLTLPGGTRAFYLYAEPNEFETLEMQATAQNGTTSGPLSVFGASGAQYLGFYANGPGLNIKTITITCDDDFAIGEFAIAS
jgi:subtilase family serine protease